MNAVTVTDQEVIIDAIGFIEVDGYAIHLQELLRTLHLLKEELKTKIIRFDFSADCQPFKLSAFDRICEYVATTYSVPKDRMILEIWDHYPLLESPWVTVVTEPSSSFDFAQQFIKLEKCVRDPDAKLFGGFYGRYTLHRFLMSYFLETEIADNSTVAFHPSLKWVSNNLDCVKQFYEKELKWLSDRHGKQLSKIVTGYNGRLDDYSALEDYHNIFSLCQIDVVLETNAYELGWWTEKTTRCLYTGKPFLLVGTQGQLNHLKDIGFKTFSPWIDESYNDEPDADRRFDLIQDEVRRISALDQNKLAELLHEVNLIADYNKNNYTRLVDEYKHRFNYSNVSGHY